ncbi:MAG: hypothetical protein LIP01_02460 [Tannerellaceae bacterium]|nr:hypothetical protein [Tannerellaceae bacterium]
MPRLMLALQIILYLVSDNREEEENEAQKEVRENAKKRSSKWRRENPISSVALVDVGVHWGADFRRKQAEARKLANSEEQPTRGKVATHFRRGHWRNQAIGPRGENQHKLIWIEATIVNPQPDGTLPGATLRKVN